MPRILDLPCTKGLGRRHRVQHDLVEKPQTSLVYGGDSNEPKAYFEYFLSPNKRVRTSKSYRLRGHEHLTAIRHVRVKRYWSLGAK